MTTISVENIEFRFGNSWTVLKYDDSPEYLNGIRKLTGVWKVEADGTIRSRGCKGVDILILKPRAMKFIEVKDFRKARGNPEFRIQNELPLEIGFKVCDTVAGVVGGARGGSGGTLKPYAKMLVDDKSSVEVILWLEMPPAKNNADSLRQKARLSTATKKLKKCFLWLKAYVLATDSNNYATALADLKVRI